MLKISIIILVVLFLLWSIHSLWISRVPEMRYRVVKKLGQVELRSYEECLLATVVLDTPVDNQSIYRGFNKLAYYINGQNQLQSSIKMTAPVLEANATIAMTAPILSSQGDTSAPTLSFVMPMQFTKSTLPQPDDSSIQIQSLPTRTMAVMTYGGYATRARVEAKKKRLLALLQQQAIPTSGEVLSARFNPPWTMPLLMKNEVMVEVQPIP